MNEDVLLKFGEMLIENVRDETISHWSDIINGSMSSKKGILVQDIIKDFDRSHIDTLLKILPSIIDTSMFYLLTMIDSREDLKVLCKKNDSDFVEVRDYSDGLAGELYSKYGWIARFSKKAEGLL